MRFSTALSAAALAACASAADNYLGFNSGAALVDNSAKFKKDFLAEFKTAQNLKGAPGKFNAVRLYTNVQKYTKDDPIEAFEAAIETETYILLGIWTSETDNIDNELSALKKAIKTHGTKLTDLIIGMSVGSEDLYRNSVTGVTNKAGPGQGPDAIIDFIKEYRSAVADTPLAKVPVGHVDTWDAWENATNKAVIDAVDFIGVDEYPYYETGKGNDISNSGQLFDTAYNKALKAAGDKPVWVTETGWPSSGPDWDEAEASVKNAKYYWNEVGCRQLFGKTPTFWYNLRDSNSENKMQFAITKDLSTTPLFDLSCPDTFETPDADSDDSDSDSDSGSGSGSGSGSKPGSGSDADAEGSTDSSGDEEGDGGDKDSAAVGITSSLTATAMLFVAGVFFSLA